MPLDLSDILAVGESSRALFDLEKENVIFEKKGIFGYKKHPVDFLNPGTAFYLIQSLSHVNTEAKKRDC